MTYEDLSEKYFSYILRIFLGFIVIIVLFAFFNPFLSNSLLFFLIEILTIFGAEFWIIYVAICYIKERKNIINLEFDGKMITILKENTIKSIFSTDQIIRISYFHSYDVYSGEKNIIKFELIDLKNINLSYKTINSKIIDFLYFLEDYSQNYCVKFIKIKYNSHHNEEKIENLKDFFKNYGLMVNLHTKKDTDGLY